MARRREPECATKVISERKRDDHTDNPAGQEMHGTPPERRGEELGAGYNRSACGRCYEKEANKRQSDMRIERRRRNTHVPGGAGIPPEPQLTQAHKKRTRQHGKQAQLRCSAGTTSLVPSSSILLECRPLACSQEEKWNSIISAQSHIQGTCQCPLNRCSMQTVSLLDILFKDGRKMVLTSPPPLSSLPLGFPCSFSQIKKT